MQLSRTKFQKSFILSTKKWIKCFPEKNPVNSRKKSGDITQDSNRRSHRLHSHHGHHRHSSHLRWRYAKARAGARRLRSEAISGMILNCSMFTIEGCSQNGRCRVANENLCLKAMRRPALTWRVLVFDSMIFFKQSATENNHLVHLQYYWPTISILISKICPKLKVLTRHFSEVGDRHWGKNA